MKIEAKRNTKAHNEFTLKMIGTAGEFLAIRNALQDYSQHSAVAQDVLFTFDQNTLSPMMEGMCSKSIFEI